VLSGGTSPTKWRVQLDFGALTDVDNAPVPATAVRKLRWTYAAELQQGAYERSEFAVQVSNWTVTGTGRSYTIAAPSSRRLEDDSADIVYGGSWEKWVGNYSGGSLHVTNQAGASLTCSYRATAAHTLCLGVLKADGAGTVAVSMDGAPAQSYDLRIAGEEAKARLVLGQWGSGTHIATVTLTGGGYLYFDFLEIAIPVETLPEWDADTRLALATDWDTEHSLAIAPERTAWMIDSLGFRGRVNHYVGAMWWNELVRAGHAYASATVTFAGAPVFGDRTEVTMGRAGQPSSQLVLQHLHRIGDTAETVAKAFELEMNRGYTSVWAHAEGGVLTVHARAMGADGNNVTVAAMTTSSGFGVTPSGPSLAGGVDGEWRTDTAAVPRLNRAARDWHRSFFAALNGRGLDAVAAFSLELRYGDDSLAAGIAQRCPAGDAVWLNTPALQTNFSPASRHFWKPVYREMAEIMAAAGLVPYVQFGEVQWWYFRDQRSGMPYYDAYTQAEFASRYGRQLATILDHLVSPEQYPDEAAFLPTLIGEFTDEVTAYVKAALPACRIEVLYPLDVNEPAWNRAVNYPSSAWTPAALSCLKTESFNYTYSRDLNRCLVSIREPGVRGFAPQNSAHLIGLSDTLAPWRKEASLARAEGVESVVLFALDQFCLIGYPPAPRPRGRASYQGS
jgi:hypothetical protein